MAPNDGLSNAYPLRPWSCPASSDGTAGCYCCEDIGRAGLHATGSAFRCMGVGLYGSQVPVDPLATELPHSQSFVC